MSTIRRKSVSLLIGIFCLLEVKLAYTFTLPSSSQPALTSTTTKLSVAQSTTTNDVSNKKHSPWYQKSKRKWASRKRRGAKTPEEIQKQLIKAEKIEASLNAALKSLERMRNNIFDESNIVKFPSIRECNGALATFGDSGDFKRALNLFWAMRKSAMVVSSYQSDISKMTTLIIPPVPTLVTYSTLMSRAVALKKEKVALRLWRLMISSPSFYTNRNTSTGMKFGAPIVPDIRAVNILMNVFAKLGDSTSAKKLIDQLYNGRVIPYAESLDQINKEHDLESSGGREDPISLIQVVPQLEPNIVTYNTMIDACIRAGDFDGAMDALEHMKYNKHFSPDIYTYTSLISAVGRNTRRRSDPNVAFELFDEMINDFQIRPNGMAYCALIDVCGRCRRSDLALKGLRMMLREKAKRSRDSKKSNKKGIVQSFTLENEVGAWTAAIDACGKAGRVDTAIRLFQTMPKFDVYPNIYTCGALTDGLLKSNEENSIDECMNVLRYMEEEGIKPSEVMYTSLITSASKLATDEHRGEVIKSTVFGDKKVSLPSDDKERLDMEKAVTVYTELIRSVTGSDVKSKKGDKENSDSSLMKVFLVLQEMKENDVQPDIACYNAILQASAKAGNVSRLRDVMDRIQMDGLTPNSNTWKEVLRGAAIARDSTLAEATWAQALSTHHNDNEDSYEEKWYPGLDEFDLLLSAYVREASRSPDRMEFLYSKVLDAYIAVSEGIETKGFHNINLNRLKKKSRTVKMIGQAIKFLRSTIPYVDETYLPTLQANIRKVERELDLNSS